jgi:hypothetical protein
LKGCSFIKAIILGNLSNANCSIDGMCQLLNEDKIEITKQGLDFRFSEDAVAFMKRMFHKSLSLFRNKLQINCKILKQFKSVKLLDSSCIRLPNSMRNLYPGCGSRFSGYDSNIKSAIKLQLIFDYLNQVLDQVEIKEGIRSDQGYREHLNNISANDLLITDLGYFVPSSFKQIDQSKAYFISCYKADTNIYDTQTEQKIDLLECLENQSFLEKNIIR